MKYITKSTEETLKLGKTIAADLNGGDIVLLQGELGAGKTVLAKGIAQGLGITETITSPTFTLMNVYNDGKLVHIDTYRLENEEQLVEIGVEDYLGNPNSICLIEWPEKLTTLLKNKKTMAITIEHLAENKREISIS